MADPKNIGKYEILEKIGRGGFAVVYKARDPGLDRVVALKVLAPHLIWDPTFAERFRHEAQATAKLRHPNIVTIYEVGQDGERLYIAMEYLPGRTLAEFLQAEGTMALKQALPILEQVARALDYAHRQDMIHRDVKPRNVIVEQIDRGQVWVKLTDFGLVKAMESHSSLTSADTVLGSPKYMAPEQADPDRKREIGPATDRYALGVVAYEMLLGRVPFDADSPLAVLRGHADKEPPNPRDIRQNLPENVAQVLLKALSKIPGERFPTAEAMVEALRPKPKPSRRPFPVWGWAVAGAFVVILLVSLFLGPLSGGSLFATPTHTARPEPTKTEPPVPTATSTSEPTPADTATPVLQVGATWAREKDGAVMVYVPAGTFWMGSNDSDPDAESDEKPQHEVYLDAFWIDRTEVTNKQYRRCAEAGTCALPQSSKSYTRDSYYDNSDFDDYPVVYVDWKQAEAYCAWAGARLPTEAEWEKAARSTEKHIYPWGNDFNGTLVNFCDANCAFIWKDVNWDDGHADTAPVGSYPGGASPYGALDMAGNVWEWTSSLYEPYPYHEGDSREDPTADEWRVLRGGSWNLVQGLVRAAARGIYGPSYALVNVGFRCARSVSGP